jgi:hypothetical protein
VATDVAAASQRRFAGVGWRGQLLFYGSAASGDMPGHLLGLGSAPQVPVGLLEAAGISAGHGAGAAPASSASGRWDDAAALSLPSPDLCVWLTGLVMEAACAHRCLSARPLLAAARAAARGAAGDAVAAASSSISIVRGVPAALAAALCSLRAGDLSVRAPGTGVAEGGAQARERLRGSEGEAEPSLKDVLGRSLSRALRARAGVAAVRERAQAFAADAMADDSSSAAPAAATACVALPAVGTAGHAARGAGGLHTGLALALANAWAGGLRSANAGLRELAARCAAAVLREAVADVMCAEGALALAERHSQAMPGPSPWAAPLLRLLRAQCGSRCRRLNAFLRVLPPGRVAQAALWRMQARKPHCCRLASSRLP